MEQRSLHTILTGYTKPQLEDLVEILGIPGSHARSKAKLVEELYSYLRAEPRRWLSRLTERDLRQLRELVHAGPDRVKIQALSTYPTLLEVLGLVSYDDSQENRHKVWIGPELYDIVHKDVEDVLHAGERNGRFHLERRGLGYLNLYGVVGTDRLIYMLLSEGYREKDIVDSPWFKLYRYEDANGDYLASPCLVNPEELFPVRDVMGSHLYKPVFPPDLVYEAGCGAPYFTVGMKSPEGMRLEAMYRRVGYSGFDLTLALHDTWVEAQYTNESNEELFGPLMDSPLAANLDHESWLSCVQIVADYANSVPKWFLCGSSAKEEEKGLVDIRQAADNEGEVETYSMGFAVPHVAPDDPCPCGSGLRYCRCHGRYLS
ncbi:MAG: SEC-C domain-containing protein [Bacteroidales bacterium]|nr:SEC-C domain-containing protein [Bacteroidales bacterium]